MWQHEVLDVIHEMKRAAVDPARRVELDRMAVEIITQDCRPIVMTDHLQHWFSLPLQTAEQNQTYRSRDSATALQALAQLDLKS